MTPTAPQSQPAPGALPPLAQDAFDVGETADSLARLVAAAAVNGGIFRVHMPGRGVDAWILNNPDDIRQVLLNHHDRYAKGIGLVDRVVEAGNFMEEVMKFAHQLASGAGKAMGYIKAAVREGIDLPMEQALAVERRYGLENLGTHDAKEGLKAFAEKRKPDFRSR
jgi:hypothetical protein